MGPRLAGLGGSLGDGPPRRGRVRAALVAAAGLALLQQGGLRRDAVGGRARGGGARPRCSRRCDRLLPPGALRFARGLPTVVMLRGVYAGAFFAGETFVPLALQTVKGATTAQAGLTLSVGAVGWALGSVGAGPPLRPGAARAARSRRAASWWRSALATVPLSLLPSVPY